CAGSHPAPSHKTELNGENFVTVSEMPLPYADLPHPGRQIEMRPPHCTSAGWQPSQQGQPRHPLDAHPATAENISGQLYAMSDLHAPDISPPVKTCIRSHENRSPQSVPEICANDF